MLKWCQHVLRISAYSGTSGSLFHHKMRNLMVSKKKNPLFVRGWDIKIHHSGSPFVITWQASWCQTVILGTDFSILPSHSWWILIILRILSYPGCHVWTVHWWTRAHVRPCKVKETVLCIITSQHIQELLDIASLVVKKSTHYLCEVGVKNLSMWITICHHLASPWC